MKNIIFSIIALIFLLSGCIKENLQDNFSKTIIQPEYSISLGSTEYILKTDFSGPGSTEEGIYGHIYFDDIAYPLNSRFFIRDEQKDFNINSAKAVRKNIESLTIHVLAINSLPTDFIITQIYFLDDNQQILFSAFPDGPKTISGGKTDNTGRVIEDNRQIIEVSLSPQNITQLGNITFYSIKSKILTTKPGVEAARFFSSENIQLVIGVRIKLKFDMNEI